MNTDKPIKDYIKLETRRQFFKRGAAGLGSAALTSMMLNADEKTPAKEGAGVLGKGHHKAKAKRVIYLFMAGAPSQLDTFDYKPK